MIPQTGDVVHVRSRQYLVSAVVPPPNTGDATLVRLSCLEDDAQGDPLDVLWERELDARLLREVDWQRIASRGFDQPRIFSAFLHTLRWSCVTATDPRLFQAPYRAGIEVKAYQLEPLRLALGMPRINLFIADDVGLGKTIEAGLILREMGMRQKVRRCVVCCPPSVVRQWQAEMEARFGLTFVIYDRSYVTRVRQRRGYGVNPWKTHTRFIISQALIRDEAYAAPLRDWLGERAAGSMLILDEAHNAAPASGTRYAIDSKLTRTMRDIAPRFEHKLFLSATPHNGHSNSFSALLEILDPQKFCRGVPVESTLRDTVMVRRLKADLRAIGERFPHRNVERVVIDRLPEDAPELVLSRQLQAYRLLRESHMEGTSRSKQAAAGLVLMSLQKRLLSSIEAFARTLAIHRRAMVAQAERQQTEDRAPHTRDVRRFSLLAESAGADDDRAELEESEVEAEEDAQMALATRQLDRGIPPLTEALALLDQMTTVAQQSRHDTDARLTHLIAWIRTHLCPDLGTEGARWLPRRVLIFTEYTDTKRYLQQQLTDAIRHSEHAGLRIATFHGGMGDERREAIKAAFNADPARHPLRILIATDAAREGVNLQNNCADLFHFDIPWNPGRIEQRNGRLDRKLQQADVVNCYYYVLPQRAEDRVLDVLVRKTQKIQQELGSLTPVVERRLTQAFRGGITHATLDSLARTIDTADQDAEGSAGRVQTMKIELGEEEAVARRQRLEAQLHTLRGLLRRSRQWIGLDDRHFRDALSAALELLGADALSPLDEGEAVKDPARARWKMPLLHERAGADPTWGATLDSLRTPRKRGQSAAEWRREAPIRPVVFRDPGNLDGEVVHLHLEHRVVQRLLSRFLSQGFREDDLCRACVLRTDATEPRVVLLGRLSLFGEGGSRLHDEVLASAAFWQSGTERGARRRLRPLGERDKADVLQLVEESLAQPRLREVASGIDALLRSDAARDVAELTPHLEQRAQILAERATRDLTERGQTEAKAMRTILVAQRARIRARQKQLRDQAQQLRLIFDAQEERQLAADQRHWVARLEAIAQELEQEPERVRRSYRVQASRVEPVGLVYLWPVSS